jgi:hypothetical protein
LRERNGLAAQLQFALFEMVNLHHQTEHCHKHFLDKLASAGGTMLGNMLFTAPHFPATSTLAA